MPLYTYNGQLFQVSGSLAANLNCCCEGEGGACCHHLYGCLPGFSSGECDLFSGTFLGVGTSCDPDSCPCDPELTVDCCFGIGAPISIDECLCIQSGGTVVTGVTECCDSELSGSCCLVDGDCFDGVTECDCNAVAGNFSTDPCSSRVCADRTPPLNDDDCVICRWVQVYIQTWNGFAQCTTTSDCNSGGSDCSNVGGVIANPLFAPVACPNPMTCTCQQQDVACGGNGTSRSCNQPGVQCVFVDVVVTNSLTTWASCKTLINPFTLTTFNFTDVFCNPDITQIFSGAIVGATRACNSPNCTDPSATDTEIGYITCQGPCSGSASGVEITNPVTFDCTGFCGCP